MNKRTIEFWECNPFAEQYHYTTQEDAIEGYLDGVRLEKFLVEHDMQKEHWPETLECKGYARKEADFDGVLLRGNVLEILLEHLDCNEDLGSPDESTKATKKMIEAERVFIKAVLDEYEVWACEPVETVTVNVKEWVEKNRPNWLVQK